MTTLPLACETPRVTRKRFRTRPIVGGRRPAPTRTLRVWFAGGGTGGHLLPGIATARALCARPGGAEVRFLGTGRPLEATLLPAAGFDCTTLPAAPFGWRPRALARFAASTWRGYRAARRAVADGAPDVVVGLGGYGMVAPCLAAWRAGIPVALLEQNAVPGLAVRALARIATAVFCHFPEAGARLPAGVARALGSPLRPEVLAPAHASPFPAGDGPALLVLGGSLGAQAIDTALMAAAPALAAALPGLRVLHCTGADTTAATLRAGYGLHGIRAHVTTFCHDMGAAYRDADLVVARAGGMTVAELCATGTPSVLVPLPSARQDHQRRNAEALVREGAAALCLQVHAEAALGPLVIALLRDARRREAIGRAARTLGRREAAGDVASAIASLGAGVPAPGTLDTLPVIEPVREAT